MSEDAYFDYRAYSKFATNMGKVEKDFIKFLKLFLLQQAQRVVAAAKPRTPVDTGALRESWSIGKEAKVLKYSSDGKVESVDYSSKFSRKASVQDIKVVGKNLQVVISNPMEYASYIEYGHHSYEGRYMLTISINEVEQAMPQRFKKSFTEFIRSKGV